MPLTALALVVLGGRVLAVQPLQVWPASGEVPLEAHLYVMGLQDVVATDETGAALRVTVTPLFPPAEAHYGADLTVFASRDGQPVHLAFHGLRNEPKDEHAFDYVARADWRSAPMLKPHFEAPRLESATLHYWLELSLTPIDRPWLLEVKGATSTQLQVTTSEPYALWPQEPGWHWKETAHVTARPWRLDGEVSAAELVETDVVLPWSATVNPWPLALLQWASLHVVLFASAALSVVVVLGWLVRRRRR